MKKHDTAKQAVSMVEDAFAHMVVQEEHEFSPEFDRKINELLSSEKKEKGGTDKPLQFTRHRKLTKLVLIAATVAVLTLAVTATAMSARVCFWNRTGHDNFSEAMDGNDMARGEDPVIAALDWDEYWAADYLPHGYLLKKAEEFEYGKQLIYADDDLHEIVFFQYGREVAAFFDDEGTEVFDVLVNGTEVLAYEKDLSNISIRRILWTSEGTSFDLEGIVSFDELVKIAESLVLIEE